MVNTKEEIAKILDVIGALKSSLAWGDGREGGDILQRIILQMEARLPTVQQAGGQREEGEGGRGSSVERIGGGDV